MHVAAEADLELRGAWVVIYEKCTLTQKRSTSLLQRRALFTDRHEFYHRILKSLLRLDWSVWTFSTDP